MDTPEEPDEPRGAVYEQILAALDRLNVDRQTPCGPCGAVAWGANPDTFALTPMDREGNPMLGSGVEVVAISCGNCGYLRLHAVSVLVK
jgi:hypothetical protein